jgi:hypothetical protein
MDVSLISVVVVTCVSLVCCKPSFVDTELIYLLIFIIAFSEKCSNAHLLNAYSPRAVNKEKKFQLNLVIWEKFYEVVQGWQADFRTATRGA